MERRMSTPLTCPPCSGTCSQGRACPNGSHIIAGAWNGTASGWPGSDRPGVLDSERRRQADCSWRSRPAHEQLEDYLDTQSLADPPRRPVPPASTVRRDRVRWVGILQAVLAAVFCGALFMVAAMHLADHFSSSQARARAAGWPQTGGR
jgi:hypothetical protein